MSSAQCEAKCQFCASAVNPKLAQKRGEMQIWCATVVANGVGSWKLRECVTLSKAEVEVAKVSNCRRRRGWRLPKRVTIVENGGPKVCNCCRKGRWRLPKCVTVAEMGFGSASRLREEASGSCGVRTGHLVVRRGKQLGAWRRPP